MSDTFALRREGWRFDCGCVVTPQVEGWHLKRCPLHETAPKLLEACKEATERLRRTAEKTEQFMCDNDPLPSALEQMVLEVHRVITAAIAEAEGTSTCKESLPVEAENDHA